MEQGVGTEMTHIPAQRGIAVVVDLQDSPIHKKSGVIVEILSDPLMYLVKMDDGSGYWRLYRWQIRTVIGSIEATRAELDDLRVEHDRAVAALKALTGIMNDFTYDTLRVKQARRVLREWKENAHGTDRSTSHPSRGLRGNQPVYLDRPASRGATGDPAQEEQVS